VSYTSTSVSNWQGTPLAGVSVTTARIIAWLPVAPAFEKGRVAANTTPLATVNDVAEPIAVPAALKNAIVPVQDAAVPLDAALARFATLTCKV
jgi:hypothetical protein